MDYKTINYIKTNPLVYSYLREDSSLYKNLIRNPSMIKEIEELAKKFYKQTREDKIKRLSESIETISTLIDVFK